MSTISDEARAVIAALSDDFDAASADHRYPSVEQEALRDALRSNFDEGDVDAALRELRRRGVFSGYPFGPGKWTYRFDPEKWMRHREALLAERVLRPLALEIFSGDQRRIIRYLERNGGSATHQDIAEDVYKNVDRNPKSTSKVVERLNARAIENGSDFIVEFNEKVMVLRKTT